MPATTTVTAADIMVTNVVTVTPDTTIHCAIQLLLKHGISGMPVLNENREVIGILSERDCLKTLLSAQYHNLPAAHVIDLMTTGIRTIAPDTDVMAIARLFTEERFRRLPVVEDGRLVGQVSRRDLLRAIDQRKV